MSFHFTPTNRDSNSKTNGEGHEDPSGERLAIPETEREVSASVHAGVLTPRKKDSAVPFSEPIQDGYFAVYRPSLTDDKIRMGAGSLAKQYELIPKGPTPAWRPWFSAKWVGLWRGTIVLQLRVALRETLGICRDTSGRIHMIPVISEGEETRKGGETTKTRRASFTEEEVMESNDVMEMTYELADKLRHQLWSARECRDGASAGVPLERRFSGEAEKGYREMQFLKGAFGLRFFNLIADDPFAPAKIVGPYDFPHLSVKNGVLEGVWRLTGTFAQEVDLRNFPFDSATWNVVVSVMGWSVGVVYDWSSLRSFDEMEVFAVRGTSKPFSALHGFYSRRKPRITIINVALPCFLVTLLVEVSVATACGWLNDDPHRATDGLNICATALLTIVAIKFAYNDSMPVVAYTTLLDTYVNSCLTLITFVTFLIAHFEKAIIPFWKDYGPVIYFTFVLALHGVFAFLGIEAFRLKPTADQSFKFFHREDFQEEPLEPGFLEPGPPTKSQVRKSSIFSGRGSVPESSLYDGYEMRFEQEQENMVVSPETPKETWSPHAQSKRQSVGIGEGETPQHLASPQSPAMGSVQESSLSPSDRPRVMMTFKEVGLTAQKSPMEWTDEENFEVQDDGLGILGVQRSRSTSENITEGEGEEPLTQAHLVMHSFTNRRGSPRARDLQWRWQ
uniref:Neurotransmitter-gated ion-channel ligand-binding domain-containing protein n=1 Tax=Chromera velia CCMP2878 TaxID=1169474 RepID=A0A0G4H470_9ALVE|eukprot:Cvel_24597.t1-p1 / transcript=Cvel_24597.t1 / gene=Cvel_24597 / organism=Chromera_velia_CCMP2878 / gene_product=hypothetical protein / transcript_product=hypothetical protein / location=Cvel_scaffold2679:5315-11554(+) / protein_length=674 / sequence_SO=supercontig / SO=protein_coding / is_pseudo=false